MTGLRAQSWAERSGGGSWRCSLCNVAILRGEIRIVEETPRLRAGGERASHRSCHVTCALDAKPQLVREALGSSRSDRALVVSLVPDLAKRDPALAEAVLAALGPWRSPTERKAMVRSQVRRRAPPPDDATLTSLLAELEHHPGDVGLLAVLGDVLQQLGDVRGELIALELVGATTADAIGRRDELRRQLLPSMNKYDSCTWGVGYLHTVELRLYNAGLSSRGRLLRDPSCRLLEAVHLVAKSAKAITIPVEMIPRSVRSLRVHGALARSDPGLSSLPHLEHLFVNQCNAGLSHPTLRWLELGSPSAALIERVMPAGLPSVRRLTVRGDTRDVVGMLARSGWLDHVTELELVEVGLRDPNILELERALAGRHLDRLDVCGNELSRSSDAALARICSAVVPGYRAETEVVEHTGQPGWGLGRIVGRHGDNVDVAFASGTRTFKANATFLRVVRD